MGLKVEHNGTQSDEFVHNALICKNAHRGSWRPCPRLRALGQTVLAVKGWERAPRGEGGTANLLVACPGGVHWMLQTPEEEIQGHDVYQLL